MPYKSPLSFYAIYRPEYGDVIIYADNCRDAVPCVIKLGVLYTTPYEDMRPYEDFLARSRQG